MINGLRRYWAEKKARIKLNRLLPVLEGDKRLLDIGTGNGALAHLLKQQGFEVLATDVKIQSLYDDIPVIQLDSGTLESLEGGFDAVLLITVLHHSHDPEFLLQQAKKLGKKVIVMEDVYYSKFQEWVTKVLDSVVNLELFNHPHNNRTANHWKDTFEALGYRIIACYHHALLGYFRQVTFVLYSS